MNEIGQHAPTPLASVSFYRGLHFWEELSLSGSPTEKWEDGLEEEMGMHLYPHHCNSKTPKENYLFYLKDWVAGEKVSVSWDSVALQSKVNLLS